MADLSVHKSVLPENRVDNSNDNVKTFLMTRMWISISSIIASLIILLIGYKLLMESVALQGNAVLNVAGTFVMMLSIVPFMYAYKALPDRRREPMPTPQRNEEQPVWRDYRVKKVG